MLDMDVVTGKGLSPAKSVLDSAGSRTESSGAEQESDSAGPAPFELSALDIPGASIGCVDGP